MSSNTDVRLTPGERLTRGLKYTALGPVDLTVGALGVCGQSARSTAAWASERYRASKLSEQLSKELAAAQEVVSNLPQAIQPQRGPRFQRRTVVLAAVGVAVLAGGAVAFSIVRRSTRPEPSPLPPTVEVEPKP